MDTPNLQFLSSAAAILKTQLLTDMTTPTTVHLVAAPFTPAPNLDISTLVEADFDGYTPKTVTGWGTVHQNPIGQYIFISTDPVAWTPTGSVTPNTIYGFWFEDKLGDVVAAALLSPQVVLNGTSTTLAFHIGVGMAPWIFNTAPLP